MMSMLYSFLLFNYLFELISKINVFLHIANNLIITYLNLMDTFVAFNDSSRKRCRRLSEVPT